MIAITIHQSVAAKSIICQFNCIYIFGIIRSYELEEPILFLTGAAETFRVHRSKRRVWIKLKMYLITELKEIKPFLSLETVFFSPKYRLSLFLGFMTENGSGNVTIRSSKQPIFLSRYQLCIKQALFYRLIHCPTVSSAFPVAK